MAIELIQLQATDLEELSSFLRKYFKLGPEAKQFEPAMLHWKYIVARPDWEGSRAYILRSGKKWLAHAGVCPMVFERGGETVRGILLVDWVSASPGAGAEIFRRFYPMIDALFGNGGSTGARATFRTLKYPERGAVDYFTYPLKPVGLFRDQSSRGLGAAAARLVRNLATRAVPGASPASGWSVRRIDTFTPEHQALWSEKKLSFWQTVRSVELTNYYLRCPLALMSAYEVRNASAMSGYFLLAQIRSEIRLVDARMPSERPEDWSTLIALATRCAKETSALYITASGSLPLVNDALRANRYRWFQADPVYLYDPKGCFTPDQKLHITPYDGDQAYL